MDTAHRTPRILPCRSLTLVLALAAVGAVHAAPAAKTLAPQLQGRGPGPYAPGVPVFQQIGRTPVATVPMKPVPCGPGCTRWKLASSHGNLKLKARVGMGCPAHSTLTYLAYQPLGGSPVVLVDSPGEQNSGGHWSTRWTEPFTTTNLELACDAALRAQQGNGPIHAVTTAERTVKKTVRVEARCGAHSRPFVKLWPVTLRLRCVPTSLR